MSKLKPCPFCGSRDVKALFCDDMGREMGYEGKDVDGNVQPWIHCYGCDSEWFSDLDDVVGAWNRRASDDA